MLYTNIKLAVPEGARYERNPDCKVGPYLRYRVESYRDAKGRKKHKRLTIGKIMVDETVGQEYFCPNDTYYTEILKQPVPENATGKKRGRARKAVPEPEPVPYSEKNSPLAFGYMMACLSIVRELGLDKMLEDSFGSLAMPIITAASFFAAGAPGGLTNIDHFTEKNMCFTSKVMTSSDLSELYSNLNAPLRNDFFRKWIEKCRENDFICYDVTSISCCSERIPLISYGYNRDKEQLPQFNFGMFCTIKTGMPLYFCPYNGSINDFTNLPYVIDNARNAGIKDTDHLTLVMDGGFSTIETIEKARDHGFDLIVGAPCDFGVKIRERLLAWDHGSHREDKLILLSEETIRCHEESFSVGRVKTRLLLFRSPQSTLREETSLTTLLNRLHAELNDRTKISDKAARDYEPFFRIAINRKDGSFTYERDDDMFKTALSLCGSFALFCTRQELDCEEVLDLYRRKDCVEKAFGALKNDILNERLRTHSVETLNGKLFLAFIGLIIRKTFEAKLKQYLKKNRMGLDSALDRLGDILCQKRNGTWHLIKAMTKQQRELSEILNLPIDRLAQ